jgi:hypothetical protein
MAVEFRRTLLYIAVIAVKSSSIASLTITVC